MQTCDIFNIQSRAIKTCAVTYIQSPKYLEADLNNLQMSWKKIRSNGIYSLAFSRTMPKIGCSLSAFIMSPLTLSLPDMKSF